MARITVWLRRTLVELKLQDDSSISSVPSMFHFIRERVAAGENSLFRQESAEMPADALTKPLGPKLFMQFREMMGIRRVNGE